jgi:hypothetical protein
MDKKRVSIMSLPLCTIILQCLFGHVDIFQIFQVLYHSLPKIICRAASCTISEGSQPFVHLIWESY